MMAEGNIYIYFPHKNIIFPLISHFNKCYNLFSLSCSEKYNTVMRETRLGSVCLIDIRKGK